MEVEERFLKGCRIDMEILINTIKETLIWKDRRRQWHPTPVLLPGKSHGWGAWWATVHGVATSRSRLSDFTFTFHFHAMEKEMATHSSVLAWRIPGTAEPGGLLSMGSHRVRHYWSDLAAAVLRNSNFYKQTRIRDQAAISFEIPSWEIVINHWKEKAK